MVQYLGTTLYAMNMYTNNPNIPRIRMDAIRLVRIGWSTRAVARHLGFTHSAVVKWMARASDDGHARVLPNKSCRPHHHPNQLSEEVVRAILQYRQKYRRCAEVLHYLLEKDGYDVSLSSVKRTLKRHQMVYPSKWKKWHQYPPRPMPNNPGILVQMDTIHDGAPEQRLYVYTLIDVCSRWAYAEASTRITNHRSLRFITQARQAAPFNFSTLQSDHGSEFSKWLTKQLIAQGLAHRYSHIRQPNDNAHVERFNRTLQEECLSRLNRTIKSWQIGIPEYLRYYNNERPHMGLDMRSPIQVVPRY